MILTLEEALDAIPDLARHPRRISQEHQADWRLAQRLFEEAKPEELPIARIRYDAGIMYGTQEHAIFIIGKGTETLSNTSAIFGASTWHPPGAFGRNAVQPYETDRITHITIYTK